MSAPLRDQPTADHRDVLASVDRRGRRQWVYAAVVAGRWRRLRTAVSALLLGFYLAAPFLSVGGEPLLRIDLPRRHVVLAGQVFWPQDVVWLLLSVLIGVIGTLLLVALLGRVFCGWLCPHNLVLEMVFRRIETWCEGPAHRRRRRDAAPDGAYLLRKALKWLAYVLVAGAIANAFAALFVGVDAFRWGLLIDPVAHPTAAVAFAIAFALVLFDVTWFREQTCTLVCPYGRLQSAMLDRHAPVVAYDTARGEPRGHRRTGAAAATGDCVDCRQCVAVCPTAIDIRNGNQLECLHCTACIDACDDVMDRLGRQRGLIAYRSEAGLAGERRRFWRPRVALHGVLLIGLLATAGFLLAARRDVTVLRLRDLAPPRIERAADGSEAVVAVVNLAVANRGRQPRRLVFTLIAGGGELFSQGGAVALDGNQQRNHSLILRLPRQALPGRRGDTAITATDDRGRAIAIPVHLELP